MTLTGCDPDGCWSVGSQSARIGYHRRQLNASAAALTSLLERCDTPARTLLIHCLPICLLSTLNISMCLFSAGVADTAVVLR